MLPSINRRALLAGLAASGAAVMTSSSAAAAPRRKFFERIGRPIALQIYTLGDAAGKDLDATFAQVAAIGYREIEMPGLFGKKPAEVAAAARRAGLAVTSLHLPASTIAAQGAALMLTSPAQAVAEALAMLGASKAVMPIMIFPAGFRPGAGETFQTALARSIAAEGEDLWKRTAALLNERGSALKPYGIRVGYHNHNVEFARVGAGTGWDILARETDPALVDFEVDVGWIKAAGLDPVTFLNGLKGRVTQLHVKDVAQGTEANYALAMKPTEVGSGVQDWAKLLPAAYDAGVRHFYVEQEPPFTIPRIEAARKSYQYLAALRA
jgi:sugar phosphate isomerase/epimerase